MPTTVIYWFAFSAIAFFGFMYWVIHEIRSVDTRSTGDQFGTFVVDEDGDDPGC